MKTTNSSFSDEFTVLSPISFMKIKEVDVALPPSQPFAVGPQQQRSQPFDSRRKELLLQEKQNNKFFKPKASYSFTRDQKRKICKWFEQLKMPAGHASNLGKCVDTDHGKYRT
uniref:Uncharacterized protein n=1 Tax=Solanum lycopersicum TaxID=4081 RepID=A0A3Q7FJG0_SOLLC